MERGRNSSGLRWIFTGAVVLLIGAIFGLALSYLRSSPPATEPEQVTKEMPSRPPQPVERTTTGSLQAERSREESSRRYESPSLPSRMAGLQTPAHGPGIAPKAGPPERSISLQSPGSESKAESIPEQKIAKTETPQVRDEPSRPITDGLQGPEAVETPPPPVETEKQPKDRPTSKRTVSTALSPQASPVKEDAVGETVADREPASSQGQAPEEAVREKAPTEFAFTIHVGSYKDPDNAQKQLTQLQSYGFEAFSLKVDLLKKGVFHRVFVGRFADRSEAESLQDRLRKEHHMPNCRIVSARFTSEG